MQRPISGILAGILALTVGQANAQEAITAPTLLESSIETDLDAYAYGDQYGISDDLETIYFRIGATWLQRSGGRRVALSQRVDINNFQLLSSNSTSNFNYQYEPGLDIVLGLFLNDRTAVEVTYLGLYDYLPETAQESDTTDIAVFNDFMSIGFVLAEDGGDNQNQSSVGIRSINKTQFDNFEVNFVRYVTRNQTRRINFYGGFRLMVLEDQLLNQQFGTVVAVNPVTGLTTEFSRGNTYNYLLGGHGGMAWQESFGPLTLGAKTGIGSFVNLVDGTISGFGNFTPTLVPQDLGLAGSTSGYSFLWDFAIMMGFDLTGNIRLEGGWQGFLVTGMALAPALMEDNVTPGPFGGVANAPTMTIDNNEVMFFHGPRVSLYIGW